MTQVHSDTQMQPTETDLDKMKPAVTIIPTK